MTHTYKITGMTCTGCETKVKSSLLALPGVTSVDISKETNTVVISLSKHIALSELQESLGGKASQYQISDLQMGGVTEQTKSLLQTYKPILLIFGYITLVSLIAAETRDGFMPMQGMRIFMSGFFLTFSFFKMLDIKGFADSYSMYDIIADKFKAWGFIYPFVELLLGIAYALNFQPVITNIVTLAVLSLSLIGVLKSVFNQQKIQCACLGAVFNLPMSSVTIFEDFLMVIMSAIMLFYYR